MQEAVQQAARNIVVVEHLDLTALVLVDGYLLGVARDATQSVIVRFRRNTAKRQASRSNFESAGA